MNAEIRTKPSRNIRVFEEALQRSLFERIVSAVREVGDERLKRNYNTTFWYPNEAEPGNAAEQVIEELIRLADPPAECIGTEWWLGRLGYGEKLPLHFDRDLTRSRKFGEHVYPIYGSIYYLNTFPSSPTLILGQVPGPDPRTKVPAEPEFRESIGAVANRYAVFPGNLRHGVKPTRESVRESRREGAGEQPARVRLCLLVNYWHCRPMPPICRDYDGSIYESLQFGYGTRPGGPAADSNVRI